MHGVQRYVPPAEAITESFYAWELRGRGWAVAPYSVELEPPYRSFGLLPQFATPVERIDDGKRPTLLSSIVENFLDGFRSAPEPAHEPEPFEEEAPYPILDIRDTVTLRILASPEFEAKPEPIRRFLCALPALHTPLSFEFIGIKGRIETQITADSADVAQITDALEGYFPGIAVTESDDVLEPIWDTSRDGFFVDLALADEFFLPLCELKPVSIDAFIPLIPALARAAGDEVLVFQVLFAPVMNPWHRTISRAIMPFGECIFDDAPEFVTLAKEKLATPLFATVLRVGALADTRERARTLARGTGMFFEQFSRPGANRLIPLTNEGYPDEEHAAAFIARTSRRTGMILSAGELAALVHPPDASISHPALVRLEKRTKGLPSEAQGHELIIGINEHRGVAEEATIDVPSRLRHMHVVGGSGTGKSTLLLNLITQDLAAGHGIAVLDPHGDLVDAVLARVPESRYRDVILFDPSDEVAPVGINLLQAESAIEKTLLSSDLVSVFQRFATSWGDAMSTVLGNAVLALLEADQPTTLLDLRRLLVEERFRKEFLARITDPEVMYFWRHEFPLIGSRALGPILTRLNTFLRPRLVRNVVAQRNPRVKLEDVVNGRKIFLAKLAQGLMGSDNSHILGSLITTKFHQVALGRQALPSDSRCPFFLYIDEFQHFVTPSVDSLLSEARKYAVGLVLAHQTLRQLSGIPGVESAVLGNVHTRMLFRVSEEDGRRLSEGLSFFRPEDLYSLKQAQAIVRLGTAANDFNVRIVAPTDPDNSSDSVNRIHALSRTQFGTAADALAREFAESYGDTSHADPEVREERPPREPPAERSAPSLDEARPSRLRVQDQQRRPKRDNDPLVAGRGGREHKYLQHLVKRLAEERGFRATLEEVVLGGAGRVDVSLVRGDRRIAFEISVSTGQQWETKNVKQSLAAGYEHVVLLTKTERTARAFEKQIVERLDEDVRARVRVIVAEQIVEYLDQYEEQSPEESVVRGYRVKVRRQNIVPEDAIRRRSDVANVIARSIEKNKEK